MAITNSTITVSIQAIDSKVIGLGDTAQTIKLCDTSWSITFNAGAGADQFNQVYSKKRTLAGSSEDLDLSGVLTDDYGVTISATEVKAWGVRNTSTHTITVGGTGGSYWTTCLNGTVPLPPKSLMVFATEDATGWTVTAGTGDLLHVAGTAGDTYEVFFWVD